MVPVSIAAVISSSQREMVPASVMSPGMKREASLTVERYPHAQWAIRGPRPAGACVPSVRCAQALIAGRARLLLPLDRHSPP